MNIWLALLISTAVGGAAALFIPWAAPACFGILVGHAVFRACRQAPELEKIMQAIRSTDQIESSVIVMNLQVIHTHLKDIHAQLDKTQRQLEDTKSQLEAIRERRPQNPKVN